MCQIWIGHSFVQYDKYGTWFLDDEQDTKQNTELKKSVVQRVLSCRFMYILTSKFIKKMKKKIKQKKKLKVWIWILLNQMRTEKQTRAAALRHGRSL